MLTSRLMSHLSLPGIQECWWEDQVSFQGKFVGFNHWQTILVTSLGGEKTTTYQSCASQSNHFTNVYLGRKSNCLLKHANNPFMIADVFRKFGSANPVHSMPQCIGTAVLNVIQGKHNFILLIKQILWEIKMSPLVVFRGKKKRKTKQKKLFRGNNNLTLFKSLRQLMKYYHSASVLFINSFLELFARYLFSENS